MIFPEDFYEYLNQNSLVGIKGGLERPTFLEIWMVEVDKRIFARSWNKSERSWFTKFQEVGVGQIQYGDNILSVKGEKLPHEAELTELINQAYLTKYNTKENLFYSQGITQPEYFDYTMEFFYDEIL